MGTLSKCDLKRHFFVLWRKANFAVIKENKIVDGTRKICYT